MCWQLSAAFPVSLVQTLEVYCLLLLKFLSRSCNRWCSTDCCLADLVLSAMKDIQHRRFLVITDYKVSIWLSASVIRTRNSYFVYFFQLYCVLSPPFSPHFAGVVIAFLLDA